MTRSRFLTSSLAAVAVASAITFTAAPANAADAETCGQPAKPAVYQTVTHPAETVTIPAQTHDEWLWQRQVETGTEYEYRTILQAAYDVTTWTRVVTPLEFEWQHYVTETWYVWELLKDGNVKRTANQPIDWASDHGNDNAGHWTRTDTEVPMTLPTDEPTVWSATSPGDGWQQTDAAPQPGEPITEEKTTTDGNPPEGDNWVEGATTHVDATYSEAQWASVVPQGAEATGNVRPVLTTETTPETLASAPEGDGWTQVADSKKTITDVNEQHVTTKEAWTEEVLVSPAVDATAPCAVVDPVDDPADPVVDPVEEPGDGDVAGPVVEEPVVPSKPVRFEQVLGSQGPEADAPAPQAALAPRAGVLPNTGNGASLGVTLAGLGSLAGGAVLMLASRRRRFAER